MLASGGGLVACWSAKGGAGASVMAVALARAALDRRGDQAPASAGVLLADLAGDLGDVLGAPAGGGPAVAGLAQWMLAPALPPAQALGQLEVGVVPGLAMLPLGGVEGSVPPWLPGSASRGLSLARMLAGDPRPVVVDAGSVASAARTGFVDAAAISILVVRPCYLALRRALSCGLRPRMVVVVEEPGRSLRESDVADVLGVATVGVPYHPAIARAVDAGLLGTRLPRILSRAAHRVLEAVAA